MLQKLQLRQLNERLITVTGAADRRLRVVMVQIQHKAKNRDRGRKYVHAFITLSGSYISWLLF